MDGKRNEQCNKHFTELSSVPSVRNGLITHLTNGLKNNISQN